jgi:hypothetical protein
MDQDLLPALEFPLPDKVPCIESPHRNGGRFLIGDIGRFPGQHPLHLGRAFGQTFVLRIRAHAKAESSKNLVPWFEYPYLLAYRFNLPG